MQLNHSWVQKLISTIMQIQYLFSARVRWIFAMVILGMFIYGMVMFPDAPISPSPHGYYGRFGNPHSEAEYQHFVLWSRAYLAVFVLAMVYVIIKWVRGKKEKI